MTKPDGDDKLDVIPWINVLKELDSTVSVKTRVQLASLIEKLERYSDENPGSNDSSANVSLKDGDQPQDESFKDFLETYPKNKQAAVLVLLFELDAPSKVLSTPTGSDPNPGKQLHVLVTTRAKTLRTHGGQTSLPGGKRDEGDVDLIYTAYREAHEEIGLPFPSSLRVPDSDDCLHCSSEPPATVSPPVAHSSSPHIHTLGTLDPLPFNSLLVKPVIAFLSRPDIVLPQLSSNHHEVAKVFAHPLEAVIMPEVLPDLITEWTVEAQFGEVAHLFNTDLVEKGGDMWPYDVDYHVLEDYPFAGMTYRMHYFRTCASPITGFTADILIRTGELVFGRSTSYERYAEDQIRDSVEFCVALLQSSSRV